MSLTLPPPTRGFTRTTHRRDGTMLIVAPRPDPARAFRRLGKALRNTSAILGAVLFPAAVKMAADLDRSMAQIHAVLRASAPHPDPARLAGLEGRYYVRAALDPTYATPEALHRLVRNLLDGTEGIIGGKLPAADRRALAVTAMRGWETRQPPSAGPPLIAHRLWASTRVEVRCG